MLAGGVRTPRRGRRGRGRRWCWSTVTHRREPDDAHEPHGHAGGVGTDTQDRARSRTDLAWIAGLTGAMIVVFLYPEFAYGRSFAVGPDFPVYVWWTRVGAALGISVVGDRPGIPALIATFAGTLPSAADGGGLGTAVRVRRAGQRVRRGAGARTGGGRAVGVDAGGRPRRDLRRQSRGRLPVQPGLHAGVPRRGHGARRPQHARRLRRGRACWAAAGCCIRSSSWWGRASWSSSRCGRGCAIASGGGARTPGGSWRPCAAGPCWPGSGCCRWCWAPRGSPSRRPKTPSFAARASPPRSRTCTAPAWA